MARLPKPESQSAYVNGLRLHYLDWGNHGAPPLVCVHGYTGSAQAFNALARRLRDRFHVIAPDVRGHGESQWSAAGAYQYADQAADVAGLADYLRLGKFTLLGTSMGGIIAMAYAGAHSERLERLVINDIGPDQEAGSQRITQMVGARPEEFLTLALAMAYRREASPILAARPEADQRETALGVLRQRPDGRWAWKLDPQYIWQRVKQGPPQRPPLWPVLQGLPCPTLVVWGMESDVLSEAQARRMVETLPRGALAPVPGIGHAPTLVEPEALAALEPFLAGPE
ncbi:MAG: alpha/beta hydrolase [Chloroflexi bacterium]|nr:alpha/beta hydrolase [Chloroflexota bacterium]